MRRMVELWEKYILQVQFRERIKEEGRLFKETGFPSLTPRQKDGSDEILIQQ